MFFSAGGNSARVAYSTFRYRYFEYHLYHPSTLQPLIIKIIIIIELLRTDGKRPDGVTLLSWKQGKCATWDVTVSDTLAQSYVHETSQTPGAAAEAAAERRRNKYSTLSQ